MGCKMESDQPEDLDVVLTSMWPEDMNETGRQFNVERPGVDQDMLEKVTINKEPNIVDFQRLMELTNYSDKGNGQLAKLVKNWEFKQANVVRLLREELDQLSKQQQEVELKKLKILEGHRFEKDGYGGDKRLISILDENLSNASGVMHLEKLLEASLQREQVLVEKLQESIENLERQSIPVEELSQVLKRADNFLHVVLQNAPVVIGHQVHLQPFPELETELFGSKTFLIYVEPVFSKTGETIGVNYMGMEVLIRKREKMAKLREEIAVQKAMETELNKTIHITEETMRAKQMLATMSHEIRSPLSGVVSMTEILATTNLDKEQRQLLKVMLSSGDLVLQLINDILDLSKVESGVMKLEATKFRPREVVKHVLQTEAASLQKLLTLEGHVAEDVPIEVIGDVLRIRQILTNLISNAIKFTHEGKVGINLYEVPEPSDINEQGSEKKSQDQPTDSANTNGNGHAINSTSNEESELKNTSCDQNGGQMDQDKEGRTKAEERVVWIRCDVYDTGIGIPEHAMSNLFKKYMQVGADTAWKYGGTGLGLAICKQLVELMGGYLNVSSVEHHGSTFTFVLPYKVSSASDTDETDELSDADQQDVLGDEDDLNSGVFLFQPRTLGTLFSSQINGRIPKLLPNIYGNNCNGLLEDCPLPSSNNIASNEGASEEVSDSTSGAMETTSSMLEIQHAGSDNLKKQEQEREQDRSHCIARETASECSSTQRSKTVEKDETKQHKILLVEDNKINIMVAKSMMKQLGYSIDVVSNGAEAVRAVQRSTYHLILMDVWEEAVKAGLEIEAASHQVEETRKRIPIIAMTANTVSESADECYANGMDSFVSKPITLQTLRQCVQNYLV
ncbi:hypothetical protein SASPL_104808 [Salvia splendens]|uniref:histidine kinase n=1 Tax=Salvia splendens TaxID=180675 RepID=A0A8X8YHV7_SALSN|nr:hypothetical protein SASPL_104808 [Salvia splendens]